MAEERIIKKINVRSPYYVNVVNRSDETQDEIDPTPTEPLVNNFTHECGDTVSIGATSSRNIYKISLTNRGTGTFTINFSNLKVPIKYRFGMEGSLPSFQTSNGLNLYEPTWLAETGETVSLSDFIANPNGVSQAITYDVTQADLDSGNKLVLEIFHPVTSAGYSFASVCQDVQAADDVDQLSVPSVLIVTVIRRTSGSGSSGVTFGEKSVGNATKRFIFSDASLAITPTYPDTSFFKNSSLPISETWNSITNQYVGTPHYTDVGENTDNGVAFQIGNHSGSGDRHWDVDYIISRHPVYQDAQNNWKFKTWRDFNEPVQAFKYNLRTRNMCNPNYIAELRARIDIAVTETSPITSASYFGAGNQSRVRCHALGNTYNVVPLSGNFNIIQDA